MYARTRISYLYKVHSILRDRGGGETWPSTLQEGDTLMLFRNIMLRKILGLGNRRSQVSGENCKIRITRISSLHQISR
jgi:hypothetical protein